MGVFWTPGVVGSPHALVVGISGQGKSVTARNVVKSALEQGLGSIVFDFHGDMAAALSDDASVFNVADAGLPFNPFEVHVAAKNSAKSTSLAVADILTSVANLGDIQRTSVYRALIASFEANNWTEEKPKEGLPTIGQFVVELQKEEKTSKGKNAESRLLDITEFDLFRDVESQAFKFAEMAIRIFDVSKMGSESVKRAAVAFILRKIYNEMFIHGISTKLNVLVLVDEAHLMAKDPTIPRLMKEGRKFGVSMVLVSQSLDDFPQEVIDNVGLKVAFRTNNPMSKKVASFLQSSDQQLMVQRIEKLQVGEAYVSMPGQGSSFKVKMKD
jgi:DNA phosphorothioation-dependent restriction protein DptH